MFKVWNSHPYPQKFSVSIFTEVVELPLLSEISKCRRDPHVEVVVAFLIWNKWTVPAKSGVLFVHLK